CPLPFCALVRVGACFYGPLLPFFAPPPFSSPRPPPRPARSARRAESRREASTRRSGPGPACWRTVSPSRLVQPPQIPVRGSSLRCPPRATSWPPSDSPEAARPHLRRDQSEV